MITCKFCARETPLTDHERYCSRAVACRVCRAPIGKQCTRLADGTPSPNHATRVFDSLQMELGA